MTTTPKHSAILIDADNIDSACFDEICKKCKNIAYPIIKRAYGDFSQGKAKNWIPLLSIHGISPHQNFAIAKGKNAADISLVIDAMDILHAGQVKAFCLISSDSDFSRLATRIKEHGKEIYGFGISSTPQAFQNACDRFETLKEKEVKIQTAKVVKKLQCSEAFKKVEQAFNSIKKDKKGRVQVGPLGKAFKAKAGTYKDYQAKSFTNLLEQISQIKIDKQNDGPDLIQLRQR